MDSIDLAMLILTSGLSVTMIILAYTKYKSLHPNPKVRFEVGEEVYLSGFVSTRNFTLIFGSKDDLIDSESERYSLNGYCILQIAFHGNVYAKNSKRYIIQADHTIKFNNEDDKPINVTFFEVPIMSNAIYKVNPSKED